jgi:hypothetical protein
MHGDAHIAAESPSEACVQLDWLAIHPELLQHPLLLFADHPLLTHGAARLCSVLPHAAAQVICRRQRWRCRPAASVGPANGANCSRNNARNLQCCFGTSQTREMYLGDCDIEQVLIHPSTMQSFSTHPLRRLIVCTKLLSCLTDCQLRSPLWACGSVTSDVFATADSLAGRGCDQEGLMPLLPR